MLFAKQLTDDKDAVRSSRPDLREERRSSLIDDHQLVDLRETEEHDLDFIDTLQFEDSNRPQKHQIRIHNLDFSSQTALVSQQHLLQSKIELHQRKQ